MARTPARKRTRATLVAEVELAGRALSTAAVLFHTALAAKQGLNPTQSKVLDLLHRFGPLTAGQLGARAGLAPASVTGLVDRLVDKGFVSRKPDPDDGRRVLVEVEPQSAQAFAPYFVQFLGSMRELYARYSVAELATIVDFLQEAARRQTEATAALVADDGPPASP